MLLRKAVPISRIAASSWLGSRGGKLPRSVSAQVVKLRSGAAAATESAKPEQRLQQRAVQEILLEDDVVDDQLRIAGHGESLSRPVAVRIVRLGRASSCMTSRYSAN